MKARSFQAIRNTIQACRIGLVFFSLVFFISCQQKPTVAVSDSGVLIQKPDYRKVVSEAAVVFDTRSPFEFNISKVPGSINLPLQDFEIERDPFDAARRLSLYGVNIETPVVILGAASGEATKLAWRFNQLGVTQVETLKVEVFRLLNLKPEPSKKNVTIWKPLSQHKEISYDEMLKQLNDAKLRSMSRARSNSLQGIPLPVLWRRVLIVTTDASFPEVENFAFTEHLQLKTEGLFDQEGLLNKGHLATLPTAKQLSRYDQIFLVDSSAQGESYAYALVGLGAKAVSLVKKP